MKKDLINEKVRKHKEERLKRAKLESLRRNRLESIVEAKNKVQSIQSPSADGNSLENSSNLDTTKIIIYTLLVLTFIGMVWAAIFYHWILSVFFIIPIWYLQKKINYYDDNKCTKCNMWNSTYIDSRDCINEWSGWETRSFNDVTRNKKGETISTTTRRQQVWVTYRTYLNHCKCKNCGDYYNYENTSSFVN